MTPEDPTRPRKYPNPWVAIPVTLATLVGWFVGSSVARVSCRPDGCAGEEILWGLAGALVGFAGVLTVAVLAVRSLAEWAASSAREKRHTHTDDEPPTC